jgi:two-component system, NtrC family, response regulator HydG
MARSLDILIADDDTDNAQSLAELFEMEGHRALAVHSGEAAIDAHVRQNFDIAFMDVVMPGKNGVESFIEIRRLKPQAHVIMMTGYSVEQLLNQALAHGALGVISKPTEPARILSLLDEVGPHGVVVASGNHVERCIGLQSYLANAGRQCHILREPASVLSDAAKNSGDIVILDFKRPLIDGMSVCANMRKAGCQSQTIILADEVHSGVSGRTDSSADFLRDVRVTGILNKPFDVEMLLDNLYNLAA